MIYLVLLVLVAVITWNVRNSAKFKAALKADISAAQTEVAALRTKAVSSPIVDTDFAKAEKALLALVSKL
jgi:hypothetical protein